MSEARILVGDVRERLRTLPDGSVRCVVTSPPYWGLRDYGHDGQLGLEQTPDDYMAGMVDVFREVRRVLADDGTLWLNLGDSYNGATSNRSGANGFNDGRTNRDKRFSVGGVQGLKPKDLVGIPWRVAFALQADGWYLRQDIIWAKPNPMPESVRDRCTKAHEYVFLLSKQPRYYYDADALKEPLAGKPHAPGNKASTEGGHLRNDFGTDRMNAVWGADGKRNKRSVWTVTTKPFKGAHFAVMPEALAEPCVLAGTSEAGGCPTCGAPWKRVMQIEAPDGRKAATIKGNKAYDADGKPLMGDNMFDAGTRGSFNSGGKTLKRTTVGWEQSCQCAAHEPVPDTVLDPFSGSGTVGVVALRHGRKYVGCELNPEYAALSEQRISQDAPLMNIVNVEEA